MLVREYRESDLAQLRAIHAEQGFDYALPDLGTAGLRRTRQALEQPWMVGLYNHIHSWDKRLDHASQAKQDANHQDDQAAGGDPGQDTIGPNNLALEIGRDQLSMHRSTNRRVR